LHFSCRDVARFIFGLGETFGNNVFKKYAYDLAAGNFEKLIKRKEGNWNWKVLK
jgi:hypothetical protein